MSGVFARPATRPGTAPVSLALLRALADGRLWRMRDLVLAVYGKAAPPSCRSALSVLVKRLQRQGIGIEQPGHGWYRLSDVSRETVVSHLAVLAAARRERAALTHTPGALQRFDHIRRLMAAGQSTSGQTGPVQPAGDAP
jgi:hypothetical protein